MANMGPNTLNGTNETDGDRKAAKANAAANAATPTDPKELDTNQEHKDLNHDLEHITKKRRRKA